MLSTGVWARSMKVTVEDLREQLERLCNYTKKSCFVLKSYSTGDRRLYQLYIEEDDTLVSSITDHHLTKREMYLFIEGYIELDKEKWD